MPDVWTTRPDHLRDFLQHLGVPCGVEPRVIKPRDPEWTCHVDGKNWIGDIYIHRIDDFWWSPLALEVFALLLLFGLLVGVQVGNRLRSRRY